MITSEQETRASGAYLGLALGDALGATVEFMTPNEIRAGLGVHREITGGGWLRLKRGQVTDDTEMSLALGEVILRDQKLEAQAAAEAFSQWMRRKPVDIGHTVRRGIVQYRQTGVPQVAVNPDNAGNGGCMRSLPVALFTLGGAEGALWTAHCAQAHVTHNCTLADQGTLCVMELVQLALLGQPMAALRQRVDQLLALEPSYGFEGRPMENPSGFIVDTLKTVFQGLFNTQDFEAGMVEVVNRGGDADTTGAIFGMIGGAFYGLEALPSRWLKDLNPAVAQACRKQALGLLHASPLARG